MPFSIPPSCVFCLLYANVTSRHNCLRDGEKEQKKTKKKKKGKIKREKGVKKTFIDSQIWGSSNC